VRIRAYAARVANADADELFWDVVASLADHETQLQALDDPWAILRDTLRAECRLEVGRIRHHPRSDTQATPAAESTVDGSAILDESDGVPSLADRVSAALLALSEQQYVAVVLRVICDWDYDQVAAALVTRESTARAHVFRGLRKLERALSNNETVKRLLKRRGGGDDALGEGGIQFERC
jgi:DNA-directed RNA polymerase specialized sigma24 family protein